MGKTRAKAPAKPPATKKPRSTVRGSASRRPHTSLSPGSKRTCVPLEALFDHAWDAMIVADRRRRIVDVNPAACRLLGTSRERLLRLKLDDLGGTFSLTRYRQLLDGELRPALVRGQQVLRVGGGSERALDAIGVRIDDNHVFLIVRDISELKSAEEEVRASEEKFRSMIRDAGPGIAFVDPAGVHLDVNDAFCRMTGFSREELIGRGMPYPYWPKDQIPRFSRGMRRALDGAYTAVESLFVRKNGERFPVRIQPSSVRDHTGATVGQIGIFEDISSWEVLQQELVYAQKMHTVGALASGVMHEFRNIHCGMALVIETALAEIDRSLPIAHDMEAVLERLDRANRVTKLLETFSQEFPFRKTRTGLSDVVREALGMAESTLKADKVTVEVSGVEVPELLLDRVHMGQAILNLILNARDSMLSSKTKHISMETGTADGRAFVRVTDTGSGIAGEHINSIFDPFFTTKEDRREEVREGFGLGLSVSEVIVRNHGGTIDVASTPGVGSSFTVWLPLDVSSGVRGMNVPDELHDRANGKRILVAENDTVLRLLLDDALRRVSCEVRMAGSAAQCADFLGSDRYDVAFLDLELPDEGVEWVLDRIRTLKTSDRPVTIVMAGAGRLAEWKKARRPGTDGVLLKPVTLDSLYAVLETAIDTAGKRRKRG